MPVSFKCGCGKSLRVKDEFAGKKVKCPSCNQVIVTPEITAEDLVSTEGLAGPKESQSSVKCLTCGAELKEDDPVCMKCGTIRQVMKTQGKPQPQAAKPFYM
ncbi:MAG: zinc-ribbon domain-containing protein, partial [Planctomycetota bacterium]